MAQASLEMMRKQEQSVLEVLIPEFTAVKEYEIEKVSFGRKISELLKASKKETRSIQEVNNNLNFRQYPALF